MHAADDVICLIISYDARILEEILDGLVYNLLFIHIGT